MSTTTPQPQPVAVAVVVAVHNVGEQRGANRLLPRARCSRHIKKTSLVDL